MTDLTEEQKEAFQKLYDFMHDETNDVKNIQLLMGINFDRYLNNPNHPMSPLMSILPGYLQHRAHIGGIIMQMIYNINETI